MFARFTDRIRKVMALANQQAQQRRHDSLAPEHIFAGLLLEGTGVGMAALTNLGVDPREALNQLSAQPDPKSQHSFFKRYAQSSAKQAILFAMEESSRLGHKYIGTEHMLLGLLRDPKSVPARILAAQGVDHAKARAEVARLRGAFCSCGYPIGDFATCPACGKSVTPNPQNPQPPA